MAERIAVILAAGRSTRMKTQWPKVLHEVSGRPMLAYVLEACRAAGVSKLVVVVGFGGERVQQAFAGADDIIWIEQAEQKGTAHAVLCCRQVLQDFAGDTLILCGDGPLIRAETLTTLVQTHEKEQSAATLATAVLEDPTGYGRIVRDDNGRLQGIVEHNDCTAAQLQILEVNPSYYIFKNPLLWEKLVQVKPDNAKGELYLTDVVSLLIDAGHPVGAVTAVRPEEALSINSRAQLSVVSKMMQQRIQSELMDSGVTIVDPDTTWIDAGVEIGADTVIEPFTYIRGAVKIGAECRIGPFACLTDTTIEDGRTVAGMFDDVNAARIQRSLKA